MNRPVNLKWMAGLTVSLLSLHAVARPADDASLRRQADAILAEDIATSAPGASVLIAQDDRIIYRTARGSANLELGVPLSPNQVFRIGSLTKTFTAAAILKLGAAGKLSLDDPLAKFLPDFPKGGQITLAELLDHTAGVSDAWDVDPTKLQGTSSLVKLIAGHAPDFSPGTAWAYSNSGYILLGAVVEKVTGQPWHAAIHSLLAQPLGLSQTAYYPDEAVVPGSVVGYSLDDRGKVIHPPFASISGPGAAGALTSTVDDLFRWMRALAIGRALPPGLYEAMSSAKATTAGTPVPYGYGLMLGTVRGELVVEHNGGIEGFASQLTYFPKQHVTVVVLANTDARSPSPRSLAHRLGALTIGKPYIELHPLKTDDRQRQELCGTYRIDATAKRTISIEDGTLLVQREGGPKLPLALAQGDRLFFPHDGTDYFQIIRGAHGSVTALDFYSDGTSPARRETRVP